MDENQNKTAGTQAFPEGNPLKIYNSERYFQHIQEYIRVSDEVLILSHYSFKYIFRRQFWLANSLA